MKERPILFSGEMVRAILAGRKTQTRRVVRFRSEPGDMTCHRPWKSESGWQDGDEPLACPYGEPGDRLWVRETWKPDTDGEISCTTYRADGAKRHIKNTRQSADRWFDVRRSREQWPDLEEPKWRPSIHMPRWASRITLEVTDVRVERVQDISEADAVAEGFERREHFIRLWDELNAKRGFGFDSNPWVFVVSFRRLEA